MVIAALQFRWLCAMEEITHYIKPTRIFTLPPGKS